MKRAKRIFNVKINSIKSFGVVTNTKKFFNVVMEYFKVNFGFETKENFIIDSIYKIFRYRRLYEFDPQTLDDLKEKTLASMDRQEVID